MAGPSAIPFTSIDAYARRYEIAGEQFERLLFLLQAMDRAILKWMSDKAKQEDDRVRK